MSNEFDTLLRDALHADAARAPQTDRLWEGPTDTVVSIDRRPRRRRPVLFVAAGLTAAAAVAAIAVRATSDDRAVQTVIEPTPTVPVGTEVALTPASTSIYSSRDVVTFMRQYTLPNGDSVTDSSTMIYALGLEPSVTQCIGLEVCWHGQADPVFGTETFTGLAATKVPVWVWVNVPDGAATVSYDAGDSHLQQTPQRGIVAFPEDANTADHTVVARAADGRELARIDPGATSAALPTSYQLPELTTEQLDQMAALTQTTLHDCLGQHGVTLVDDGAATVAEGTDLEASWAECVGTTQQTVRAAIESLGVPIHTVG